MRRLLLILPVVVVFVAAGVALFRTSPAFVGRPAPGFALPDLARPQETTTLASLRGEPAVLNFWASWCDPCRTEAPELARTARAFHDRVRFLGVTILDGRDAALAYVGKFDLPYPSVRDARGNVSKLYRVTGVPETIFLDARGIVVGHYIGAFTNGQLEPLVAQLVALKPGEVLTVTGHGETRPVP